MLQVDTVLFRALQPSADQDQGHKNVTSKRQGGSGLGSLFIEAGGGADKPSTAWTHCVVAGVPGWELLP